MDGHDAPISLSPTSMSRPEEGLQHHPDHPGVEYSIEYAETPQAPSPYPEHNNLRRQSIPWSTHPRNVGESRRGSLAPDSSRRESIPWDPSRRDSNAETVPPSVLRRQTTNTLSHLSENGPPQDTISPDPLLNRLELGSQTIQHSTEILQSKEVSASETSSRWDHPYLRWAKPRRQFWCYALPILSLCLLAVLIALIVLYLHSKKSSTGVTDLIIITTQESSALPLTDSALGAAVIVYGSYFINPTPSPPDSKLVYTTANGSICIRTYSASAWLTTIQCITNLYPKPHTPLAILDWFGGPSIYFISTSNQLMGIDNVPANNTWKLSSLNTQVPPVSVHPQSQLATVTWLNGSSAWLYYQDTNLQLREYGIDDYRDTIWRNGALGPLGLALEGTGIGTARYLLDGGEVLEVFIQTDNNAIHGRVYQDSIWEADFYSVDGTNTDLSPNAALTATTVYQDTVRVFLAWVSSSGFLNIQSRDTVNVTQYNTFSDPKQMAEGDGGEQQGLAATGIYSGEPGGARVYFADGEKILELGGNGTNWTTVSL